MTNRLVVALVTVAAVAIVGAPIAGATPAEKQYDNHTASIAKEKPKVKPKVKVKAASKTVSVASKTTVASKPAPVATVAQATSNDLPFTGLNTGLILLLGGGAIAGGLGLRRIAARRHE